MESKRVRKLTERGAEIYETNRHKNVDTIEIAWKSVESQLNICVNTTTSLSDLRQPKTELEQKYKQYMEVSYEYVGFLSRTNTTASRKDLDTHNSISQAL